MAAPCPKETIDVEFKLLKTGCSRSEANDALLKAGFRKACTKTRLHQFYDRHQKRLT